MIHDFCGGLNEELLRTNFILVYELIDEIIVSLNLTNHKNVGLWTPINNESRYFKIVCAHRGREMLYWNHVMIDRFH